MMNLSFWGVYNGLMPMKNTPLNNRVMVIDLDGVVADFITKIERIVGPAVKPFEFGWGLRYEGQPEKADQARALTKDPETYRGLDSVPMAQYRIAQLIDAEDWVVHAVTCRPENSTTVTEKWLFDLFPGVASLSVRPGFEAKVKRAIEIGPSIMVDDHPPTIRHARERGLNAVIFDQPWNKEVDDDRAYGWNALYHKLREES